MLYISLDFSFFPLIFSPFLGIDHSENVSMRYRYPKVLGYRVLGIDIDPALVNTPCLGRHGKGGGGASRASILVGEARSAAGAMKVIEIL